MKIILISNYFNHHQKPICEAFHRATAGNFFFIATMELTPWRRKMGYREMTAPYVLKYSPHNETTIKALINEADAVITDAENIQLTAERYRHNKLTFRYAERLFKSKSRYLKAPLHAWKAFRTRKMHMLCSSAFTARDFKLLGFYKKRSYKWGYFPESKSYDNEITLIENKKKNSILWVGRLIDWKHPESTYYVANRLSQEGYDFDLRIIGSGEMDVEIERAIQKYELEDKVHLLGSMSPEQVRAEMEKTEIFLFTSDRGEGWGAVLNEAMNSGCAVVASDKIGAVPFLIKNNVNGLSFVDRNWDDLYLKTKSLIDNRPKRIQLALQAMKSIKDVWNADQAVSNFLQLVEHLTSHRPVSFTEGPCSPEWNEIHA